MTDAEARAILKERENRQLRKLIEEMEKKNEKDDTGKVS